MIWIRNKGHLRQACHIWVRCVEGQRHTHELVALTKTDIEMTWVLYEGTLESCISALDNVSKCLSEGSVVMWKGLSWEGGVSDARTSK